eukprot:TRINITY_DN10646_c0_g1_i1.p1 TRINITY_DN10646_c0_g1~~TRINITY_DN10646_c0_g1_i1.p1  ORF type:complete len:325 (-),score=11.85 TRINITY_DN10646_c0_g1_i1:320-1294(-)
MMKPEPENEQPSWRLKVGIEYIFFALSTLVFALYSKSFLIDNPRPWLLTFLTSLLGTIIVGLYLLFFVKSIPSLKGRAIDLLIVLFCHCIGTVLTNISTGISSASFVNTLKAAEPLFAVVLAKYFLGQSFTKLTYLSLLTIVGGITVVCLTEFDFQVNGLLTSVVANLCFPVRTTFTKRILMKQQPSSKGHGLVVFFYLSSFTFLATLVPTIYESYNAKESLHGFIYHPSFKPLAIATFSHCFYNILSFRLVELLSALTYSVGNSTKRLIIIYTSLLYFQNPVSWLNILASLVAVFGVFMYSYDREIYSNRLRNSYKGGRKIDV